MWKGERQRETINKGKKSGKKNTTEYTDIKLS